MSRWLGSWLPGSAPENAPENVSDHPGHRFGLPVEGVGSTVGFGRRLAALTVDWLLGYLIAVLFRGSAALDSPTFSWLVLGVWFVITAIPVAAFGASAGMMALGIRVASIDSAAVIGVARALLRTALIAVVVPPLVQDADGRGWHDRAARTIVVRTRA